MDQWVTLRPGGQRFEVEEHESILQAGLKAGLALNYGCSNGTCGLCRARRISGDVQSIRHSDYVFKAADKAQDYVLTCVNTAASSELELEAQVADGVGEIVEQQIEIRVKSIDQPGEDVLVVHARTPRSQRFRFLAGQGVRLSLTDNSGTQASLDLPVASCPCDDRNLEFHIRHSAGDDFCQALMSEGREVKRLQLVGPVGDFVLPAEITGRLVFIAEDTGFAPVRSLVEHAMSLDEDAPMSFYWLAGRPAGHYMSNLCRSWADFLDDFHYSALTDMPPGAIMDRLEKDIHDLAAAHYFAAGSEPFLQGLKQSFAAGGIPPQRLNLLQT
jgi:CDP-4-dehydro-6-deoxyglucose reductase